jgi:DNA modification methylase
VQIERIEISKLTGDPANARKHNERNIQTIVESLNRFGQQKPVVVDSSHCVRAGNGTLEAARSLGWTHLDCVVTDLKGTDAIAYAIADNRTAELAEWDTDVLTATLEGLQLESMLEFTGFSDDELAELMQGIELPDDAPITEDEVPEPPVDPITKPGDLWILGRHRVLCGDSTKAEDVARLMDGAKADLCFTSPPYGQQRDYTKEGKEKCSDWDALMQGVFANLPMADDGQVLVNLGLIHRENEWIPYWDDWVQWMRKSGWRRFALYVWDQTYGLPGDWSGRFAPSFELVFHFNKKSVKPQHWVPKNEENIRLALGTPLRGKDGTTQKATSPESGLNTHKIPDNVIRVCRQQGGIEGHPAPFSVGLASYVMNSWQGIAYEPFCGSGTTIIAAEQLNRTCYGMEISPQYCDVIVKRWENLTGQVAYRHGHTGDEDGGTSNNAAMADQTGVSGSDNKAPSKRSGKSKKQPA